MHSDDGTQDGVGLQPARAEARFGFPATATATGAVYPATSPATLAAPEVVRPTLSREERNAGTRYLVTEYINYVARILRHLGTPPMDLDDGIQRTFIIACNRLESIRPGYEKGFLFKVAAGVASHARRSLARRNRVIVAVPEEPIEMIVTPDQLVDEARMREVLDNILERMPLVLRSVFLLHEFEGMTMAEIAKSLDIAPGTVASRLRRARAEFRSQLRTLSR